MEAAVEAVDGNCDRARVEVFILMGVPLFDPRILP